MSVEDILFEFGTVGALSKEEATHSINQLLIKELQNILDNASGGGNWRRVIIISGGA